VSETADTPFDVVIAGGSYAGMALARGLSQATGGDVRIAIVEPSPASLNNDNRAFAIWAGAVAVLKGLGVWDTIAPHAEAMTSIEITDSALADGVRPTRLTYLAAVQDGAPAAYMVPASALAAALAASIADDPAITWVRPAEATGLAITPQGAEITVNPQQVLRARLCVAADGRNSRLRDAAGIKTVGWRYRQTGIVANLQFSEPHHGIAIQHFLPGGPFAVLPLKNNQACITWSAADDEARRVMALDDAGFLDELDTRVAGRFGTISLVGARQSWPLGMRLPRDLIKPRFVLIGDAAHGVHPIAGQGVNLALRDCAALIEVLVDAVRIGLDFGDGPALERYQRWRRFDATLSSTAYDSLNRAFGVDGAVIRAGRGLGLGILDRLPEIKQMLVNEAAGLTGDLPKLLRGEAV
jgi:2-octaprenyl-6-methoxyphenol hydroxylase